MPVSEFARTGFGKLQGAQGGTVSVTGARRQQGPPLPRRTGGKTFETITSLAQLEALLPGISASGTPILQLLTNHPLFSSSTARFVLHPDLYKQLQKQMLDVESATGVPFNQVAAAVPTSQVRAAQAATGGGTDTGTDTGLGGGGVSSSSSQSFQPVLPPVQDILMEMRERRKNARDAAIANFTQVLQAAPVMAGNLPYFPGFEPGGAYDVALGQVTGKGTQAAGAITPQAYRTPQRVALPALPDPNEPSVGDEFGSALDFGKQIIQNLISVLTGSSQSSGTSSSGGGGGGGSDFEQSFINSILGAGAQ